MKTTGPGATGLSSTFAIKLDLPKKPKPAKPRREKDKEPEKVKHHEAFSLLLFILTHKQGSIH